MNRAVLAVLIITILVVLAFIAFLCVITNASEEVEEIPLLPHHYILNRTLRPEPSITIHDGIPFETLPLSPTEEDKVLFDNLTVLLFELIITVYREHLRLHHHSRQ